MELLTTKIIALTLLGTLSLFFGLLPLRVRKFLTAGSRKRERITSYCLCFGGGVLLATVFIHMLPETREGFNSAFALKYITSGADYPLAELVICSGFFLIYCVEELVHKLRRDTGADDQKSSSHRHHHHHHHRHHHHPRHSHAHKMETMESEKPRRESGRCSVYSITEAVKKASVGNPPEAFSPKNKWAESGVDNPVFAGDADATSWNPELRDAIVTSSQVMPTTNQDTTTTEPPEVAVTQPSSNGVSGGHSHNHSHQSTGHSHSHNHSGNNEGGHSHLEITKLFSKGIASNFRSVITILALSIHSVFEGLAVGLQERVIDVWYLFGAIAAHKFVIAFCLGIKLLTTMSMGLMVVYMVVFALVTPMGIAIGILVTESSSGDPGSHLVLVTVLQGLAGGTILYVTFFEILERERAKDGGKLLKMLFVIIGFSAMATMETFTGHSHGPSGGHGGHSHGGHFGHSHGGDAVHHHGSHDGHHHDHDHDAFFASTTPGDLVAKGQSLPVIDVTKAPFVDVVGHDHHGHDHGSHANHADHADLAASKNTMEERVDVMKPGSHDGHDHGPEEILGSHDGHDHGPEEILGSHDGHDHGPEEMLGSHDGHDHGPGEVSGSHDGHDHGQNEASSFHDGHDHGPHEVTETNDGHNHENEASGFHDGHDHGPEEIPGSHDGHDHATDEASGSHDGHNHGPEDVSEASPKATSIASSDHEAHDHDHFSHDHDHSNHDHDHSDHDHAHGHSHHNH